MSKPGRMFFTDSLLQTQKGFDPTSPTCFLGTNTFVLHEFSTDKIANHSSQDTQGEGMSKNHSVVLKESIFSGSSDEHEFYSILVY